MASLPTIPNPFEDRKSAWQLVLFVFGSLPSFLCLVPMLYTNARIVIEEKEKGRGSCHAFVEGKNSQEERKTRGVGNQVLACPDGISIGRIRKVT